MLGWFLSVSHKAVGAVLDPADTLEEAGMPFPPGGRSPGVVGRGERGEVMDSRHTAWPVRCQAKMGSAETMNT